MAAQLWYKTAMTAQLNLNRPGLFLTAALFLFPGLLFLPVLYYSLTTPFGLVDDYNNLWSFASIFDDAGEFFQWVKKQFLAWTRLDTVRFPRYVPFWEFSNGLLWKIFGPTPWLHRLTRWMVHFGSVLMFLAAFRCFVRSRPGGPGVLDRFIGLLPPALLVYLWLFFPNSPASRTSAVELEGVFFLSLCLWMLARMLSREGRPESLRAALLTYALFFLGYCGMAWSKETNIAALLVLLAAYYVPLLWELYRRREGGQNRTNRPRRGGALFRGQRTAESRPAGDAAGTRQGGMVWKLLGGLPLALVFSHTLVNVYAAAVYAAASQESYGAVSITPELLGANARWLLAQLFQSETSLLITAGLALLSLFLLGWVGIQAGRRQGSGEGVFVLILLGLFASMYLVLCTSWLQALRYWYPLIPLFTTLLAFAAKFALEGAAGRRPLGFRGYSVPLRPALALLLTGFVLFFIAGNYYNFLYQTVAQHHLRNADARLLAEITRLQDQGQYVQVVPSDIEPMNTVQIYFAEVLPHLYGRERPIYRTPPEETGRPYYIVNHASAHAPPAWPEDYRPLAYARGLATALQFGPPYRLLDAGVGITWVWQIYANDLSALWSKGDYLYRDLAELGAPAVNSDYALHRNGDYLIYRRAACGPAAADRKFFAHIRPVNLSDLPEWLRGHDFDNLDAFLEASRFSSGGKCFALLLLPDYPIRRVNTGQYLPGQGEVWSAELYLTLE